MLYTDRASSREPLCLGWGVLEAGAGRPIKGDAGREERGRDERRECDDVFEEGPGPLAAALSNSSLERRIVATIFNELSDPPP